MRFLPFVVAGSIVVACGAGCTWQTGLPSDAAAIPIDRARELVVTDDATLAALSSNAANGPASFRRAMEHLPMNASSSESTLAWMRAWSKQLRDEGDATRADALDARVTCAWLRRDGMNRCSDSCATCAATVLHLEDAPFRLVAIANRTDLSVLPDRAADGGEGRLVFALTDGPADSADTRALAMTVIIEYAQNGTAKDWATRWHALATPSAVDFPAKLAGVVGAFVGSGSLAQIRTADLVTGALVFHEFHLASGELVAHRVRNTPDWSTVAEADVRAFADANTDAIENGTHVVPPAWLATSSALDVDPPAYVATVTSHDALVRGTCAGCHRQADGGFQIDPRASGDAKLSRFLVDPTKDSDELRRRTQWMQLTLSAP